MSRHEKAGKKEEGGEDEQHDVLSARVSELVFLGIHVVGLLLPNVKDEPRRSMARLVRKHEA